MESQKEEIMQKEKNTQQEEIVPKEEIVQDEDYPLIPQRMSGTRLPYTEEDIYYLTHPETWIRSQISPLLPPLPRRQNAVQVDVTEVVAVAGVRACSNLAEALEFLARFETTP